MRIGIDFDRVLFRTGDFKQFLDDRIDGFLDTYPEGNYDPREHADELGIKMEDLMEVLEHADEFTYDDVPELGKLEDHTLVLVTRGDPVFQKEKVERSGVKQYFDEIVIVTDGAKSVADIDFLVDDWDREIERADCPGMLFDRDTHGIEDILERVESLDG